MSSPLDGLEDGQLRQLLNLGAGFAVLQIAADALEKASFDDEDAQAAGWLPVGLRTHTVARLIEATEAIREELRAMDAALLPLTFQGSTEA